MLVPESVPSAVVNVMSRMWRALPELIACACAASALVAGVAWGGFYGGGPDESGFVSQADTWARGAPLITPVPEWATAGDWYNAIESAVPAGYAPDSSNRNMAPVQSPGLPLIMALFERLGGPQAVFYVVPIFGAVVIGVTFALGRRMAGPWAGAIGAALMLLSPPFLWMLVRPMSDVPDAACWSAAVLFAWRPRLRDGLLAGVAAGLAVLIRANTAPLIAIPALLVWWRRDAGLRRVLLLAIAAAPAAVIIAVLNTRWYGSPLRSGYGTLPMLYSMSHIGPNLQLYGAWFLQAQTPLMFLWLAAPYVLRVPRDDRVRVIIAALVYPVAVFAMYAAYMPWHEWAYLRFLLPAYPAICASFGAVCVAFTSQVSPRRLSMAAVIAVVVSLGLQQWHFARDAGAVRYHTGEPRFARAVEFARFVEPNAILLSDAYSGTLRFYAGRDILRWQMPAPQELDRVLVSLRDRGHAIFFVDDPFEEE